MRALIGRRRLLVLMAGASLGLAACSTAQPAAPAKPDASPAKPADASKPAAAA